MLTPFDLERPNSARYTHVVKGRISRGSGTVPAPQFFFGGERGTSYIRPSVWHTTNKFCTAIKVDERKNFTRSTTPPLLAFVIRMLTRDLFAVSNLVRFSMCLRICERRRFLCENCDFRNFMPKLFWEYIEETALQYFCWCYIGNCGRILRTSVGRRRKLGCRKSIS